MTLDWQIFCKETTSGDQIVGCFGKGQDVTYLDWILSAWGQTMIVSLSALVLASCSSLGGLARDGARASTHSAVRTIQLADSNGAGRPSPSP